MKKTLLFMAFAAFVGGAFAQPIVVMQSADANSLDPTMIRETPSFNVLLNIFDGLLFKQPDGTFSGGLAQEWRAVDDTTWELQLRRDVTFHNGERFDANAVLFTIQRILDPEVQSPIVSGFEFIADVEVVDDYTLIITTSDPQPLAEVYFSEILPVPPAYFQEVGAAQFAQAPVGTGPYRFVSWRRDVAVTLESNPDYWGGAPELGRVEFRPTPEATTRFASLAAGEADLITSVPPSLVSSVQASPNAKLETVDSARVIYVGINTISANPALADARVRQALNYAVDVEGIIEGIFGGLASPTTTLLTATDFGSNPEVHPYPYDPERARELLAEAGVSNLTLTLGTPNGRYVNDVQVAQAIQAQLEAVGIGIDLQVREYGAFVGELFSGAAPDLFLIGWGNPPMDADYILHPLLYTGDILSYFSDPRLDSLLDTGRHTVDRDARLAAYQAAVQLISDEAPMIFLYKPSDAYGVSDRLNWTPRADELIILRDATLN